MCSDAAIHIALWHPGVKQAAPLRRQKSTGVDRNQQKSTISPENHPKSAEIDKSHQLSTEVSTLSTGIGAPCKECRGSSAKTHVLEHKGLWRRCACFSRQVLISQREGMWRLLLQMWHKCATADSSTL